MTTAIDAMEYTFKETGYHSFDKCARAAMSGTGLLKMGATHFIATCMNGMHGCKGVPDGTEFYVAHDLLDYLMLPALILEEPMLDASTNFCTTTAFCGPQPPTTNRFLCCLLYTSPSPRDQRGSRMPSSA